MFVNGPFHHLGWTCPQFGEVVCFLIVDYVRMGFGFCIWVLYVCVGVGGVYYGGD